MRRVSKLLLTGKITAEQIAHFIAAIEAGIELDEAGKILPLGCVPGVMCYLERAFGKPGILHLRSGVV